MKLVQVCVVGLVMPLLFLLVELSVCMDEDNIPPPNLRRRPIMITRLRRPGEQPPVEEVTSTPFEQNMPAPQATRPDGASTSIPVRRPIQIIRSERRARPNPMPQRERIRLRLEELNPAGIDNAGPSTSGQRRTSIHPIQPNRQGTFFELAPTLTDHLRARLSQVFQSALRPWQNQNPNQNQAESSSSARLQRMRSDYSEAESAYRPWQNQDESQSSARLQQMRYDNARASNRVEQNLVESSTSSRQQRLGEPSLLYGQDLDWEPIPGRPEVHRGRVRRPQREQPATRSDAGRTVPSVPQTEHPALPYHADDTFQSILDAHVQQNVDEVLLHYRTAFDFEDTAKPLTEHFHALVRHYAEARDLPDYLAHHVREELRSFAQDHLLTLILERKNELLRGKPRTLQDLVEARNVIGRSFPRFDHLPNTSSKPVSQEDWTTIFENGLKSNLDKAFPELTLRIR